LNFLQFDLGQQQRGAVAEVTLSGNAANVRLLDSSNFQHYKSGRQHRYYGGHATRSPVRLTIPNNGHWYIVIDTGGYRGRVKASVSMLPGPLPPIRQQVPTSIRSIVQDNSLDDVYGDESVMQKEYDVFISHATEDKDGIVRPLANALVTLGLRVWYDEFELRIGDSLRRKIDAGLAQSRFGLVVLSHAFFAKNWPQYELDGLVTREMTGQQVILPIWHNISKDEIIARSPSLADKVARSTADYTVQEIADEIANVIWDSKQH